MFGSIQSRIFVAVVAILGLVASGVMLYSQSAVRGAMVDAEERSIDNVLNMAELAVRSEYHMLLTGKVALVQERKAQFRQFDATVLETLARYRDLAARGVVSDNDARAMALDWLAGIRPVGGEYLLVFDRGGQALVHPEEALVGSVVTQYADFKGRSVVAAAWDEVGRYGEAFLIYHWKAVDADDLVPRYGHFVAFDDWEWMIASVGDVEEVQREVDERLERFKAELARSLDDVRVAGDGFVFISDGADEVVVAPAAARGQIPSDARLAHLRDIATDEGAMLTFVQDDGPRVQARTRRIRSFDWYVTAVSPEAAIAAPATALVWRQAAVFAGGLAFGLVLAWLLASGIARPLVRLGDYARALSGADFSRERPPAVRAVLPRERVDEIGELARAFDFMETELHRNVRSLVEVAGERERIEGELGVARDIQLGLLPKVFPAFPERPEFEVYATLSSAREVGGDLYDFHLDGDALYFSIGDVAGKGVPAALFMAITKTLMKSANEADQGPADAMREVNESLARDNPNSMFVTALNAVLDCRTGQVRYANGGHNPPLVLRADGRVELLREISGPALGALDGIDFDALELRLAPGELLLFYTDGVTEAMDENNHLYGDERLLVLLGECRAGDSPEAVIARIVDDVRRHAGAAEQSDDITLLALRFNGTGQAQDEDTGA